MHPAVPSEDRDEGGGADNHRSMGYPRRPRAARLAASTVTVALSAIRAATRSTSAPTAPGGEGDRARVQRHVAALDAVGGERAQGGEVRREADRRRDERELVRGRDAEDLQREPRRRVHAERAAHGAERERHLELADEAVAVAAPDGERRVAAAARRERVRAGLDGAPVVAGRHHDGVDAVHDALVVRRGAVRIELGEAGRVDDAVDDRRSASRLRASFAEDGGPSGARELAAYIGEIRRRWARHRTRTRRRSQRFERMRRPSLPPAIAARAADRLGDGVDEVRAHRVAAVDEDVHDDAAFAEVAHLDRRGPPPRADEFGDGRVAQGEQLRLRVRRGARARPPDRARR